MGNAKVRKDSFWGDFVNALLLSRPHRGPTQTPREETNSDENKKSDADS